jgi:ATP-dependent DNA helicase RecG
VLEEIEQDMESSKVMNRLVQGDVGSGKTIVAVAALVKAAKSGYQGAFMVPTEILAAQHYSSLRELLEPLGLNIALLTGSTGAKDARRILEGISTGEIDIIVGTHALIEDKVVFENLGLVITDEQHRFGVRQRAALGKKGVRPDMLVMTATPIPRTLALILYGDLDISIIDELPPGRKKVLTYAVDSSMRERVYNFIRKQVVEGRQVYIVCPLVEESDAVEAVSASELAYQLAHKTFSDLKVGLVHGKMRPSEKDDVMKRFISGETDILVSTTVIEVGVNVPNAALMVIENAERFGLSQLHQLRGRVGRSGYQSYCILFNDSKSELARERMKVMTETIDGFVISEKDLELRGPGDFFGTRQHGIPELKIANLYKDMEVLKKAQEAAEILIRDDRLLEAEENRLLGQAVSEKFSGVMNTISMN